MNLLPGPVRKQALSAIMGRLVPFVGTAGVVIDEMSQDKVVTRLRNRRKVRNHIRGLHAGAMTLLAETASGFVVGMNLPDDKIPLMKTLKVDFTQRCSGGLRVEAVLSESQRQKMLHEPKGDVSVAVTATDEDGANPIRCEMIWAWIPRKREEETTSSNVNRREDS